VIGIRVIIFDDIMDIDMPGKNGIKSAKFTRRNFPTTVPLNALWKIITLAGKLPGDSRMLLIPASAGSRPQIPLPVQNSGSRQHKSPTTGLIRCAMIKKV